MRSSPEIDRRSLFTVPRCPALWASFLVLCAGFSSVCSAQHTLTASPVTGGFGDSVTSSITCLSSFDLISVNSSLSHDATDLDLVGLSAGSAVDPLQGGLTPDFLFLNFPETGPGGETGFVFGVIFAGTVFLPVAVTHELVCAEYTVVGDSASVSSLTFGVDLGPLASAPEFVGVGPIGVTPTLEHGVVTVLPQFIRGDLTQDGAITLADSILLLRYLFFGDPIDCVAATDVNASDSSTLVDVILLLTFTFVIGAPPPVQPFPTCGIDLLGLLTCDTPPCP